VFRLGGTLTRVRSPVLGVAIGERALQLLSGVEEPAHDGALRHAHRLRHLLVRHAFDLSHEDYAPVIGRQCIERCLNAPSDLASTNHVERVGAVDAGNERKIRRAFVERLSLLQLGVTAAGLSHEVDGEVVDNSIEPSEKRRTTLERSKPSVNPKESVLYELAGVIFVADETESDRERSALMPLDELAERGLVAFLRQNDKLTVLFRLSPSGLAVGRPR
jgi:hypothetical protein